jgi:hypothetical protein
VSEHPGFVAVTLVEPEKALVGVGCGGTDCERPAVLVLMVIGEVPGSDDPTFYPTCRECAARLYQGITGRKIGRA